ncbi:MAG: tetratricopeptide repeat protein [Gemmataceae bacterium]
MADKPTHDAANSKTNPNSTPTPDDALEAIEPGEQVSARSQISGPLSGASVISWDELMKTRSGDGSGFDLDNPHKRSEAELFTPTTADEDAAANFLNDTADVHSVTRDSLNEGDDIPYFPGESSTVDLNSDALLDLPEASPEEMEAADILARETHEAHWEDENESGRLDLAGPDAPVSSSSITSIEPGSERIPNGPDTAPIPLPRKNRHLINGLLGGLAGVCLCAALWFSGIGRGGNSTPVSPAAPAPQQAAPAEVAMGLLDAGDFDKALNILEQKPDSPLKALLVKAKNDAEQMKKLETDVVTLRNEAEKAKAEQAKLSNETAALKAAVTAAKTDTQAAEAQAAASMTVAKKAENATEVYRKLAESAKDLEKKLTDANNTKTTLEEELKIAKADLAKANEQLANMKPTTPAPAAPKTDEAELAKLKAESRDAESKARTAEEKARVLEAKLAEATQNRDAVQRSIRELNGFAAKVRQKLQTSNDASVNEVISAIDKAMEKPAADLPPVAMSAYSPDASGDRSFAQGLSAYRQGQLNEAERAFSTAIRQNDRDARYWYFLGLTRLSLGKSEQAADDLRQGAERERRNLPHSGAVDQSLERLPIQARLAIDQYRTRG